MTLHLSEWLKLKTQVLARMGRKRNPLSLLVGMQTGAGTLENSMEVPQNLKIKLLYDRVIALLLGNYPKKYKNTNSEGYMHSYVYCRLFTIAKLWNVHT